MNQWNLQHACHFISWLHFNLCTVGTKVIICFICVECSRWLERQYLYFPAVLCLGFREYYSMYCTAHGPSPDAANPDSFKLHSLCLMLYDLINNAVMGMCRLHRSSCNSPGRTVRTWLWLWATSRNSTNVAQIVKCMKCTFLYRWQEVFCFDCVNLLIWINIITLHTYNSCWFILIVANICSEYTGLVVMC